MEPTENATAEVEIAEGLQDADGEVEVIVRFESVDRATLQASDDAVETLKTKAKASQGPLQRYAAQTNGISVERDFWLANAALVTVDTEKVSLEELGRVDGVEGIHENRKVPAASPAVSVAGNRTTTTATSTTWGLDRIDAPEVWENYGTKGDGARVAVLDTGIDADHQDLDLYTTDEGDPTYPGGWAEFDDYGNTVSGSEPFDCGSHGTHVSGTVSGGDASGEHIGVAPDIELLHGGVLVEERDDGSCFGWTSQVIGGMEWAVENDADVISMSLGGERYSDDYADAVENAESSGVLVVASAGNTDEGSSNSPGNVYDSFAIGASDSSDDIASFSSGELVSKYDFTYPKSHWPDEWIVPDVAAPGVWVESSTPGDNYGSKSGTSMAAPHVAGTAALMESATSSDLSPAEMKRALEDSARKPDDWDESNAQDSIDGKDTRYGLGIINAHTAVSTVSTGTLNGTVTDGATGDPIADATITAVNGSETYDATAESDGTFEFEVDDDKIYNVTIERDGYESVALEEYVDHSADVDLGLIALDGNASLEGTVTDDVTETALENVTVTATDPETGVTYENETDASGAFALDAVRGDVDYELTVSAPGYEENTSTIAVGDNDSATAEVALTGDSTLTGTVTDRVSNATLPNASVTATSDAGTYEAATAADGTYNLTLPGNETTYELSIEAGGYESWSESETLNGSGANLDAALTGDGNMSLSLTEKHFANPVSNASITVANETYGEYPVSDDGDGDFTVANVSSAGTYEITVEATGYETYTAENETVDEGATASHEASLTGNATIAGTLTDAYGETAGGDPLAVENATIEVTRTDAAGSLTLPNATDSNGTYAATVPGIDANYTVTTTATYYEDANLTTAALGDGASTTADLKLVGNATLSGTVTTTGVQTENATVTATTDASGWNGAEWGNDSADESLAVAVPGTGRNYTVEATSRAFSTNSTTVGDVTTDADFGTLSIHQLTRYLGVNDLTAPGEVEEGDDVPVEAKIVNLGTEDWNETATFHVAGSEVGSQNVSLNGTDNASAAGDPWANVSVTFTHSPDSPGDVTYGIGTANETVNATVTVEESSGGGPALPPPPTEEEEEPAEPALEIVDHDLPTTEIETGETVTVETTVENTGDAAGTKTLELTADGETADYASVNVDAEEDEVATFETTIYDPGEYELAVDGETVGTVTVVEPETGDETDETGDDENSSSDDAPDDDGMPGFGATVGAIALVAAALLTRRG